MQMKRLTVLFYVLFGLMSSKLDSMCVSISQHDLWESAVILNHALGKHFQLSVQGLFLFHHLL